MWNIDESVKNLGMILMYAAHTFYILSYIIQIF